MGRLKSEPDHQLLSLLADGQWCSGEQIGSLLGVSRAAVWKRLQKLETLGLYPERVKGKGYRLPGGLSLLSAEQIHANLARENTGEQHDVHVLPHTGSTNDDALQLAQENALPLTVVLAEHQTSGRGRRGRKWVSPYGSGIFLSIAWKLPTGLRLDGLSLVVGMVAAQVLEDAGLRNGLGLKWPNDLYWDGKKLGGILIELQGSLDADALVVIGLGINGNLPVKAGEDIDQAWVDLASILESDWDRNYLASELIRRITEALNLFASSGFSAFHQGWQRYDLCHGQQLRLLAGDREVNGVGKGVNESGALLIESVDGVREYYGGEVSVRLA